MITHYKDAQEAFTPSRPLTELECVTIAANINAETVREQQQEIHKLERREHQAAVILATALACGGYQPQHAHWIKDAAEWLNARTAT